MLESKEVSYKLRQYNDKELQYIFNNLNEDKKKVLIDTITLDKKTSPIILENIIDTIDDELEDRFSSIHFFSTKDNSVVVKNYSDGIIKLKLRYYYFKRESAEVDLTREQLKIKDDIEIILNPGDNKEVLSIIKEQFVETSFNSIRNLDDYTELFIKMIEAKNLTTNVNLLAFSTLSNYIKPINSVDPMYIKSRFVDAKVGYTMNDLYENCKNMELDLYIYRLYDLENTITVDFDSIEYLNLYEGKLNTREVTFKMVFKFAPIEDGVLTLKLYNFNRELIYSKTINIVAGKKDYDLFFEIPENREIPLLIESKITLLDLFGYEDIKVINTYEEVSKRYSFTEKDFNIQTKNAIRLAGSKIIENSNMNFKSTTTSIMIRIHYEILKPLKKDFKITIRQDNKDIVKTINNDDKNCTEFFVDVYMDYLNALTLPELISIDPTDNNYANDWFSSFIFPVFNDTDEFQENNMKLNYKIQDYLHDGDLDSVNETCSSNLEKTYDKNNDRKLMFNNKHLKYNPLVFRINEEVYKNKIMYPPRSFPVYAKFCIYDNNNKLIKYWYSEFDWYQGKLYTIFQASDINLFNLLNNHDDYTFSLEVYTASYIRKLVNKRIGNTNRYVSYYITVLSFVNITPSGFPKKLSIENNIDIPITFPKPQVNFMITTLSYTDTDLKDLMIDLNTILDHGFSVEVNLYGDNISIKTIVSYDKSNDIQKKIKMTTLLQNYGVSYKNIYLVRLSITVDATDTIEEVTYSNFVKTQTLKLISNYTTNDYNKLIFNRVEVTYETVVIYASTAIDLNISNNYKQDKILLYIDDESSPNGYKTLEAEVFNKGKIIKITYNKSFSKLENYYDFKKIDTIPVIPSNSGYELNMFAFADDERYEITSYLQDLEDNIDVEV